jgi:site-specific recombinase XerD
VTAALKACGFHKLADLKPGRLASWLADQRVAGLGVATSNHYLVAAKSFGQWLLKDRRWPENTFAHLSRLNGRADVRRERRVLTTGELSRLIHTAEASETTFRGLSGPDRATLYCGP